MRIWYLAGCIHTYPKHQGAVYDAAAYSIRVIRLTLDVNFTMFLSSPSFFTLFDILALMGPSASPVTAHFASDACPGPTSTKYVHP